MQFSKKTRTSGKLRSVLTLVCGLVMMSGLSGCLVAGYSSRGGGFLWPGGLGLVVMILLVLFLMRRR